MTEQIRSTFRRLLGLSPVPVAPAQPGPLPPAPSDRPLGPSALGEPESVPPRTPDNLICLRGPCRHYWHLVSLGDWGNPADTWSALGIDVPRPHHHTCLVSPSRELDFSDNHVFECNRWDPLAPGELAALLNRRQAYFNEHPEHSPLTAKELEQFLPEGTTNDIAQGTAGDSPGGADRAV